MQWTRRLSRWRCILVQYSTVPVPQFVHVGPRVPDAWRIRPCPAFNLPFLTQSVRAQIARLQTLFQTAARPLCRKHALTVAAPLSLLTVRTTLRRWPTPQTDSSMTSH